MKCYYTIDKKTLKKVFIPMCWETIHTHDIDDCICPEPTTEYQFQKKRFNLEVNRLNGNIKAMQSEIIHLNSIIKKHKITK
jgi:hypothetical protein